jgi:alkanesulfonate monooxygenase SsuD/methylene tetrahydromethanopterin reductase-like flavin-dependent oxidoreductase (luciferase family)
MGVEKMMNSQKTKPEIRVGVLLHPQLTTFASYSQAVQEVEGLGVDTIWNWDHFFLTGIPLSVSSNTGWG